jgi:hypothetical protein
MRAEESSSRDTYPVCGKCAKKGDFDDLATEVFGSSQTAHTEGRIQYLLGFLEGSSRTVGDFLH